MSTKNHEAVDAPTGEALFEQVHEVLFLFRSQVHQALREEPRGAAHMEMKVLGFFARRPGATQTDLVQHSGRDKGQVARLVKAVMDRGLLRREPEGGRRGGLTLTEEGRALQSQVRAERARLAEHCAAPLSAKERTQLIALLRKLQSGFDGDAG